MLEITKLATEKLKEYLAENKVNGPVRVAMHRGCGGASLGLALDDKMESDTVVDLGGLDLIIDSTLLGECGKTTVDFKPPSGCGCGEGGFSIVTEIPLPGGRGGCGGSCASGSCG